MVVPPCTQHYARKFIPKIHAISGGRGRDTLVSYNRKGRDTTASSQKELWASTQSSEKFEGTAQVLPSISDWQDQV